mmetsp:Transcript_6696/g.9092  ORF Transcript_6696/g.9092 Transcript_6696/m.9092 type:complete len:293 (+) Transcript_6696:3-881(+)
MLLQGTGEGKSPPKKSESSKWVDFFQNSSRKLCIVATVARAEDIHDPHTMLRTLGLTSSSLSVKCDLGHSSSTTKGKKVAKDLRWDERLDFCVDPTEYRDKKRIRFTVQSTDSMGYVTVLGDASVNLVPLIADLALDHNMQLVLHNARQGSLHVILRLTEELLSPSFKRRRCSSFTDNLQMGLLKIPTHGIFSSPVKERYFVLQADRLVWFRVNPAELQHSTRKRDSQLGEVVLDMATRVEPQKGSQKGVGRYPISITTRGKTLQVGAKSELDRKEWMESIQAVINAMFQNI